MKNRKKTIFLIVIFALGAFFAPVVPKWFSVKSEKIALQAPDFDQTRAIFMQNLKNEEKSLWQEINHHFGVNLELVSKNHLDELLGAKNCPKNEPMYQLIYDVAKEYNFNADKLSIVLKKNAGGSPAFTNEMNELTIDMNIFPTLSENVQRFIIAHELHHILNNDFAEIRAIKKRTRNSTMTPNQQALLQKYERFQEKRADINAALKGQYWTEGYLAFAQEGIKRCVKDPGITHPTYKDRKQIAENILEHANIKIA